jgi:hypothetical protein
VITEPQKQLAAGFLSRSGYEVRVWVLVRWHEIMLVVPHEILSYSSVIAHTVVDLKY